VTNPADVLLKSLHTSPPALLLALSRRERPGCGLWVRPSDPPCPSEQSRAPQLPAPSPACRLHRHQPSAARSRTGTPPRHSSAHVSSRLPSKQELQPEPRKARSHHFLKKKIWLRSFLAWCALSLSLRCEQAKVPDVMLQNFPETRTSVKLGMF